MRKMNQGCVYMVNLNDAIDSEQKSTRPCVIISCDSLNKNRKNVIIAPITASNKKSMVNHYIIDGNKYTFFICKRNTVLLECLRDISKSRLEKYLGELDKDDLQNILNIINCNFVDKEV